MPLDLVLAVADEVRERVGEIVAAGGGGPADKLLETWHVGMGHCMAMLRHPDYRPMEDIKRDRLVAEMTQWMGAQMIRIGEGLLQREKTDRLAGLLEKLRANEAEQKKASHRKKKD